MRKIPYGRVDFKEIITQNYLYVDKTKFIETLELYKTPLILRPRRFGKSLFLSTLYYYYDVNHKNQYGSLFANTYIGANPTPLRNSYYVLRLDFSNIDCATSETIEESFFGKLSYALDDFLSYYRLDLIMNAKRSVLLLEQFLQKMRDAPHKLCILIDEYDNFVNGIIGTDLFAKICGSNGLLKNFYSTLKSYSGSVIDRIIITGVSPITVDSLTSGFNIAEQVSTFLEFNDLAGFTHQEMKNILEELQVKEQVFNDLERYYDGYKFSDKAEQKIFNSTMVFYYLRRLLSQGRSPEVILDDNILSDYKKVEVAFDLYADSDDKAKILIDVIGEKQIFTREFVSSFSSGIDLSHDSFVWLLYYLGFLTLQGRVDYPDPDLGVISLYAFVIPNSAIAKYFEEYGRKYLSKYNDYTEPVIETIKLHVRKMIHHGVIDDYIAYFIKYLNSLNAVSITRENDIHSHLFSQLYCAGYNVLTQERSYGGYYDILLRGAKGQNSFLFELKYSKDKKSVEEYASSATNQLSRYVKGEMLANIPRLQSYALIFYKDDGIKCSIRKL